MLIAILLRGNPLSGDRVHKLPGPLAAAWFILDIGLLLQHLH